MPGDPTKVLLEPEKCLKFVEAVELLEIDLSVMVRVEDPS